MSDTKFQYFNNRFGFYALPEEYMQLRLRSVLKEGRVYEPRTIEFIRENCGAGDVITGGSYIGDFIPAISKKVAPDARVHTFEPNPVSHAAAARTIEINRLTNVTLHHVALGAETSKAALKLYNESRGGEIAGGTARIDTAHSGTEDGFVEVDVATLDSLIPEDRQISIIHFDLEGFEKNALKGAVKTVTRSKPIIILEGKGYDTDWLNALFPGCNYTKASFFEANQFFLPLP